MTKKTKTADHCNLCGICNTNCPVFKVLLKESAGPRFKTFLAQSQILREVFFLCTRCGVCVLECPAGVEIPCLEMREKLVEKGFETPQNKLMRENIKLYGNPFGQMKKTTKIKYYYT
jgi:Fe-S oxidoreductase